MHTQTKPGSLNWQPLHWDKITEAEKDNDFMKMTQTKQAKHTQWWVDPIKPGIVRFNDDPTCGILAGSQAKTVVRAVNSHEELLGALQRLVDDHDQGLSFDISWSNAKAALAHATGE